MIYEPPEEQIYTAVHPGPHTLRPPAARYLYVVKSGGERTRVQKLLAAGKRVAARRRQQQAQAGPAKQ